MIFYLYKCWLCWYLPYHIEVCFTSSVNCHRNGYTFTWTTSSNLWIWKERKSLIHDVVASNISQDIPLEVIQKEAMTRITIETIRLDLMEFMSWGHKRVFCDNMSLYEWVLLILSKTNSSIILCNIINYPFTFLYDKLPPQFNLSRKSPLI